MDIILTDSTERVSVPLEVELKGRQAVLDWLTAQGITETRVVDPKDPTQTRALRFDYTRTAPAPAPAPVPDAPAAEVAAPPEPPAEG